MPEEGFLRRWARVKASGDDAAPEASRAPAPPLAPQPVPAPTPWRWARAGDVPLAADGSAESAALAKPGAGMDAGVAADPSAVSGRSSPTLDDVAQLTPDSDYSIFVGQGVDKSVQRLALKKLFADPHFNVMDRLDMYMDDYNIPSPVSEAMLAQLDHARSALRRFVEEDAALAPALAPALADAPAPAEAAEDIDPDAQAHNEAAHADTLAADIPVAPGDGACQAPAQEHGPFHRPNQQLRQGQA